MYDVPASCAISPNLEIMRYLPRQRIVYDGMLKRNPIFAHLMGSRCKSGFRPMQLKTITR